MRQLCRAAQARRQEEWDRTAALMSWIEAKISGKWIDPARLNPYRQAAPRKRGPVSEAESKVAWQLLGRFLRGQ